MYPSIRHLVMILALLLASSAQASDLAATATANDFKMMNHSTADNDYTTEFS